MGTITNKVLPMIAPIAPSTNPTAQMTPISMADISTLHKCMIWKWF
jgi:hypothetical protein